MMWYTEKAFYYLTKALWYQNKEVLTYVKWININNAEGNPNQLI
jgi:hypothetical protein